LRAEPRRVDDDTPAFVGEALRRAPGILARVHDHAQPVERLLAHREPRDRALRVGIDDGRAATLDVPMDCEATRQRALAAAALHGCHCNDGARHLPASVAKSTARDESLSDSSGLWADCLQVAVSEEAQAGRVTRAMPAEWAFPGWLAEDLKSREDA